MSSTTHQNFIPDEAAALLTGTTLRVLHGLLHYRNRVSGRCCPRMATIGTHLHVSETTVKHHVRRLRAIGIIHAKRGRYANQYDFTPTDQWAPLIRSNSAKCRPLDRRKSDPQIDRNPPVRSAEIRLSEPPASLYEPSVLNPSISTNTDVPPPITVLAEPASPVGAPAAVPIKEKTPEQTPTKPPAQPEDKDRCRLRPVSSGDYRRLTPIASPEAILKGIEPELAKFIYRTFRRLIEDYPSPGLPLKGLEVLARMMTASDDPRRLAKRLESSCSRWQHSWSPSDFKPQLWRWLSSGDWQYPPADQYERRRR